MLESLAQRFQNPDAIRALAAGALQLVIEGGIFKRLQIQSGGMLHYQQPAVFDELICHPAIPIFDGAAKHRRQSANRELKREEEPQQRTVRSGMPNRAHHGIDNQLPYPQAGNGQKADQHSAN